MPHFQTCPSIILSRSFYIPDLPIKLKGSRSARTRRPWTQAWLVLVETLGLAALRPFKKNLVENLIILIILTQFTIKAI